MRSKMFSIVVWSGLAIALFARVGQSQEVIVQQHHVVPHNLYAYKCAYVTCNPDDPNSAQELMKIPVNEEFCSYCPNSTECSWIGLLPKQQWMCDLADPTPPPTHGEAKYGRFSVVPNGLWTVKVTVCYCNGKAPVFFNMSGESYCAIVNQVRAKHCENYDPCEPTYLRFCVISRPDCRPACYPRR